MKSDQRRVQRIALESPIDAVLAKHGVRIVDLSTTGARVEHPRPLGGRRQVDLHFEADGRKLNISCELVRSRLQKSTLDPSTIVYSSGLRFSDPSEMARDAIRRFVARLVERNRSNDGAGEHVDASMTVAV